MTYDEESVEVHKIHEDKYKVTLVNKNNRKFILNKKTSLRINNNVIGNKITVDIMAKKSRLTNTMVIIGLCEK